MLTYTTKPQLNPANRQNSGQPQANSPASAPPIQRKAKPPQGPGDFPAAAPGPSQAADKLPGDLQQRMEAKSGLALDDVRVHHNSPLPEQIGAHAFTKGTDIHLGPGEEKHLPHEAWHTVQQKQGRVKATDALFGIPVNDQSSLESEADTVASQSANGVSPALTAPEPSADGAGEGVVQGVFMKDDGETAYTQSELNALALKLGMNTTLKNKMNTIHSYKSWRYLSNWLEKNELELPKTKKRGFGKEFEDDEFDSDLESPSKVRKVKTKKKKVVPRGTKKKIFQNNLGFKKTPKKDMDQRDYYPTPDLDFSPFFPKVKKPKKEQTTLPLSSTMSTLKNSSTKFGFRGNTAPVTFRLVYTSDNKSIKTTNLNVEGVDAEYESADQFSGSKVKKKEIFEGIQELHSTLGLHVSKSYGPMLHSERNMVFQFDKKKIDINIIKAITAFAKKTPKIKILSLLLVLYSDPNEVCSNCGTALHALTESDNIQNLGERLENKGLDVDDGFSMKIITGAKTIGYGRTFTNPFVGNPEDVPSVMFTYNKDL